MWRCFNLDLEEKKINHSIHKWLRLYFLHLGDEVLFKATQTSEDATFGEYGEEEMAEDL